MERFKIIAFTHNNLQLEELGKLHMEREEVINRMEYLKKELNLSELMYISTCNRVEFLLVFDTKDSVANVTDFLQTFKPQFSEEEVHYFANRSKSWFGINAVNHLIEVASSLDSMVLGEREIIKQVKESYNFARENKLAGDMLRIVMKQTIETAKRIFTETDIAKNPVSVVSLAYRQLVKAQPDINARIVVVGAGTTNVNMCKFFKEYGFTNFTVYNRNVENAKALAGMIGGEAKALKELGNHKGGFDILLGCTAASEPLVDQEIYHKFLDGDREQKTVIDLAVPVDVDPKVIESNDVNYISVASLKKVSDKNLLERKKELIKVRQLIYESLEDFKQLFKLRQVELQMRAIPQKVKDIRSRATSEVFSKEIESLDDDAKETLNKILNYMEKKYVSVPMLAAKKLVEQNSKK